MVGAVAGVLLLAALAGCGEAGPTKEGAAAAGKPEGIGGTWRATPATEGGEVTIVDHGDRITLRNEQGEFEARRTGPDRYEGSGDADEGRLHLVATRQGDALTLRMALEMPGMGRIELGEVPYQRVATTPPPAAGGGGARGGTPAALVGAWRHTEIRSLGDSNLVTDYHLELEADGRCVTWSRSAGFGAPTTQPRTPGSWRVEGDRLQLKADAGGTWVTVGRYALGAERLMITTGDGQKRVYERR